MTNYINNSSLTLACVVYTLLTYINIANAFTTEEERWLNSDDETDVSEVNEGQLVFINKPTNKKILHSINKLTITKKSIEDGWVKLLQCYRNLDQLNQVEITYKYRFIKNLTIISTTNIESARIVKQNIELTNIKNNSELCVSADVRIFYQNEDLSFSLVNGPYHRRFLDGFYPYHVSLHISYPESLLSFVSSTPKEQKGFSIVRKNNELVIDSYFEGILNTEVRFELRK